MNIRSLFLLVLLLTSEGVLALSDNYVCEVRQIVMLDDAGSLKDATSNDRKASLYKPFLGKTFVVNRSTGKIDGGLYFIKTTEFETVTVISDGREQNEFRAVSVGRPPTSVTTFLYIRETANAEDKPFMMMDSWIWGLTFSGTCK
jgi:hypothetical protein